MRIGSNGLGLSQRASLEVGAEKGSLLPGAGGEGVGRAPLGEPAPGEGQRGASPAGLQCLKPRWVRTEPGERRPGAQSCLYCGFEMFLLLNVLSFFLPACLPLDLLLSRVADEAFYKQPFADVIGYVYVAKLIPFLVLILLFI